MTDKQPKLPLTISLNVLEHLGINLYSNVPAVLAETVANAWDADASTVHVKLRDNGTIVIQDDGIGMSVKDIVHRFLKVGYSRRDDQPGLTRNGRRPMGRKGIGKLSLFSIARIIDVETVKHGVKTAFRLDVAKIRSEIRSAGGEGTYYADHQSIDNIDFQEGTRLTLRKLRRRQSIRTTAGLKRRVARRFSIIGSAHGFQVSVNGDKITPADRDYYDKIRYIWTYGDQEHITSQCNVEEYEDRTSDVIHDKLTVSGWLATVRRVRDLKDTDSTGSDLGDNLNRIAIFVRGKLAQEDMLADLSERGVYASYLIGELHVDDLDQYDGPGTPKDDDATTSSRQRILEDDGRYRGLQQIVLQELKHIQGCWKKLRSEEGVRVAVSIPAIKDWLEQLPDGARKKAGDWLGRLNRLRVEDVSEQKNLIKHAVLAYEFYRANEELRHLESVADEDLEATLRVFKNLDDVENSLYGQITRQRLHEIDVLRNKVENNEVERKVQKYLFDHLWLLEPSWERVEASEVMERRMERLFQDIDASLTEEERLARIDIKYRRTAGQHVIIELKRPETRIATWQVIRQLDKYKAGMSKILEKQEPANQPVEFVLLLGRKPTDWSNKGGRERSEKMLRSFNARVVFYDKMLNDAYERYADYRKNRKRVSYLESVIEAIEDYAPPEL